MVQTYRQLKNRIRSIENTQKVTSAMQMVSVSKLNRIDHVLTAARPYLSKLNDVLSDLICGMTDFSNPFMEKRKKLVNICLCLVTSDSGLCGVYNNTIIRLAEDFIREHKQYKIRLVLVGRKGFDYFKKRQDVEIPHTFIGLNGRYSEKTANEITNVLIGEFLSGAADEVYVAYTRFQTALIHKPTVIKFLNLDPSIGKGTDYIVEPNKAAILDELISKHIFMGLRLVLLEAFTSEHAARTVAMKMATENANDMLQHLVLLRNKVRQASITQDIMEIISSSEALKG